MRSHWAHASPMQWYPGVAECCATSPQAKHVLRPATLRPGSHAARRHMQRGPLRAAATGVPRRINPVYLHRSESRLKNNPLLLCPSMCVQALQHVLIRCCHLSCGGQYLRCVEHG